MILVDNELPGFRLITSGRKWLRGLCWGKMTSRVSRTYLLRMQRGVEQALCGDVLGDSIRSVYGKLAEVGRFKAEWTTGIEREGTYEIFVFTHELDGYYRERKKTAKEYFYRIEGEGVTRKRV